MISIIFIILGSILIALIILLIVWFKIPYSPLKKQFQNDILKLKTEKQLHFENENFTSNDFSQFPTAIQKYITNCGYIGTPKMSYLNMEYRNVNFSQGKKGPTLKIDYSQYNFINEPNRMAFIDSSMFGIPFQGYDYYQDGTGGMKGVLAKLITLFNQKGEDMDKACLATFLAECLFAPSILLQDYITFKEINDHEVTGTITYKGQTASGIFTFNDEYEMISFTTKDRAVIGSDGKKEYIPWSALCNDYKKKEENGIKYPSKFQAVWNYSDGDFIYFDGTINKISYDLNNEKK